METLILLALVVVIGWILFRPFTKKELDQYNDKDNWPNMDLWNIGIDMFLKDKKKIKKFLIIGSFSFFLIKGIIWLIVIAGAFFGIGKL